VTAGRPSSGPAKESSPIPELPQARVSRLREIESEITALGPYDADDAERICLFGRYLRKELEFSWEDSEYITQAWPDALNHYLEKYSRMTHDSRLNFIAQSLDIFGSYEKDFVNNLSACLCFYCICNFWPPQNWPRSSNGCMKVLAKFQSLVKKLHEKGIGLIELFETVLANPQIPLLWYRDQLLTAHDLLRKKAINLRREYISLESKARRLLKNGNAQLVIGECQKKSQTLSKMINDETMDKFEKAYRNRSRIGKSSSKVWDSNLRAVTSILSEHFKSDKRWERPGGLPGPAISNEVWQVAAQILGLCYPTIWSTDASAVARLKSRSLRLKPNAR